MTTNRHQIEVRGIPVEVVRKDIKNLHLGVYPPNGRVRVAVPLRLADEALYRYKSGGGSYERLGYTRGHNSE